MSLDTVKKLASELGNEQLTSAVAALEESSKTNLDRISTLERDLAKSIEKRDRQASLIRENFGIDEITPENLKKVLENKSNTSADEVLKAENQKLLSMAEALKSEKEQLANQFAQTANSYKIEKSLMSLGAVEETENQRAYEILLNEVTKGSTFDDNGNLVFKANDGTTVRNADGTPTSLSDRYNTLKESDEFKFLFKQKRSKSGSGSEGSTGKPNTQNKTRSTMSATDKAAYIRENGQEAYLKLPK